MATKKKKDDEESFASKLAGVGEALSEGGEDEAESSLESISKIVDGISAIAEARKAAKEAKLTKNAIKGGEGDYSWGGPEEKKQLKTDKAVKGGKGDFSDFGAVKDFFGDLGSGALSTLGMLDPRVIASMGKSKENIAALSKRIDNNKKKLGEETVNKNGIVKSVNEVLEFAGTNAGDPPSDSSDKSLFAKGKESQLDPTNPTHGVVAKAYKINHKNATANEENTNYQIMLKKEAAKETARNEWLQKTSNSPAAKAFEPDDPRRESWDNMRYEQHLKHTGQDTVDTPEAKIEEDKLKKENTVIEDNKAAELPDKTIADDTISIFEKNKDKFKIGGRSLFGNMA